MLNAAWPDCCWRDHDAMNRLPTSSAVVDVIPALVPGVMPRSPVVSPALPVLARESAGPVPDTDHCLPAVARLDGSGRFRVRPLLLALGWPPGTRLQLRQAATRLIVRADPSGGTAVTSRGLLALPVAARRWLGVDVGSVVVAIAVPVRGLMIVAAPDRLIAVLVGGSEAGHAD